jgi:hypothetical protein
MLSADDLRLLQSVFQEAVVEAEKANFNLPALVMSTRLFDAFDRGERDRDRLRLAALSAEIIPLMAHRPYAHETLAVIGNASLRPRF